MNVTVISYSWTGNNDALATSLATALAAKHVKIVESKPRNNGTIILDMVFNRTPKVDMPVGEIGNNDLILFVGPVWMGQIATPLRACFRQLSPKIAQYAFISISGGADGPNPKLAGELQKRLLKEPVALIDMHIADLLPPEPKPTRNDTMAYRIKEQEVKHLTDTAVAALHKAIGDS
jgi:hypothetical protein